MPDVGTVRTDLLPAALQTAVTDCAREFNVSAIWLFGSMLTDPDHAHDIDLAVEGVAPEKFFAFYSRLWDVLPKPVDLVDLSEEPPIAPVIREEGVRIYER